MGINRETFLQVLKDPRRLVGYDLRQWDEFLPMAHQVGMFARIAAQIDALGLTDELPSRVRPHFESARMIAKRHAQLVRWEVSQLDRILAPLGVPVVLLKGAAYLMSGAAISHGRVYSDVDILVPRTVLGDAERILKANGWEQPEELGDQEQYYRRWMHELLPLVHSRRRTKLDVHHNVLPAIDELQFDPKPLFADAQRLPDARALHVLSHRDMVVHNIIHLFRNGEYRRALRDLLDLDQLLADFSKETGFFDGLLERIERFDLYTPCFLATHYAVRYLGTPIPAEFLNELEKKRSRWPPVWALDRLFEYASFPERLSGRPYFRRSSLWVLERYPLNFIKKTILPKLERWGVGAATPPL